MFFSSTSLGVSSVLSKETPMKNPEDPVWLEPGAPVYKPETLPHGHPAD